MRDNSFEKQITDKLNNFEVQPSEGLLETIFNKRAARPKRFAGMGYSGLALAVLVLSVVSAGLLLWNDGKQTPALAENTAVQELVQEPLPQVDINENRASAEGKAGIQDHTSSLNRTPSQAKNKINKTSGFAASRPSGAKPVHPKAEPRQEPSRLVSHAGFNPATYFDYQSKPRPVIDYEEHRNNSHLYVYQSVADEDYAKFNMLFTRVNTIKKLPIAYEPEATEKVHAPQMAVKHSIKRKPIFVDVMISPSLNMHKTAGNADLEAFSNAMAKASYNSQFGVRVSIPIYKQFTVFSGINYRNQSNTYSGSFSYGRDETRIDQHLHYINDPVTGSVIVVSTYDTVNYRSENKQSVKHNNTYKLFQLPLGISYNFGYKRFDFAIHASALLNAFKGGTGVILKSNESSTETFNSNKTVLGIGSGLSWMAAYKVSPKLRLILEPGIQYFGIQSMKFGNNTNERVFNGQLNIGLRYTVF